jgi:hypothetical protein
VRSLVESSVEARQGGVVLIEANIYKRDPVGRDELSVRKPFQLSEYLTGLIGAAGDGRDEASR